MLIISPSLSLCMPIFYLRYKLEDDRRAAESSFGTFTVNIYCKLFLKKSLLIFSDHLFYQYRGTLLIARKELKHLPTWGIGIVDGWPLTWLPSWEKRAETLRQGTVKKSRQLDRTHKVKLQTQESSPIRVCTGKFINLHTIRKNMTQIAHERVTKNHKKCYFNNTDVVKYRPSWNSVYVPDFFFDDI